MASFALRSLAGGALFAIASASAVLPACGAKKGSLMLAITTDMQTPKDISVVSLTIKTGTAVKHNVVARVRPDGTVEMPGTIAIVEPDDPNQTIRVRVIAFQERKPRVLRDIRTTVPRNGRTALLRVPLTFINDGSATGELPPQYLPAKGVGGGAVTEDEFDPYGASVVSRCVDPDQTVIDGVCQDSLIDATTLPDYDDTLVFGPQGQGGPCFSAATCLAGATLIGGQPVPAASGRCTVPFQGEPAATLNLALGTPDTGTCFEGRCVIPIDNGDEGWRAVGPNIELAAPLCALIAAKPAELKLYRTNGACPAKLASQPLCSGASTPGDGGRKDGPGDPGAVEKVMPERYATGVALSGLDLYVVGEQGLAVVQPGQQGKRIDAVLPSPDRARFISASGGGVAIAERSNTGYVAQGQTASLVTFPVAPGTNQTMGVAFLGQGSDAYIWAVDPQQGASPGVFTSGSGGFASLPAGPTTGRMTAVTALSPTNALFGTFDGKLLHCELMTSTLTCGLPQPEMPSASAPIDALRSFPGPSPIAFFLQDGDVYLATPGPTYTAKLTPTRLVAGAGAASFVRGTAYPRGIVGDTQCVFYSSQKGIEWVPRGGGAATILVDLRPQGGVALGVDWGVGPEGKPYIYWAQYGLLEKDGGAYRVPVPAGCLP